MTYSVLITGASGMVGKGVLLECLEDERIHSVLVLGRSRCEVAHPKLYVSGMATNSSEKGRAMINVIALDGAPRHMESSDINHWDNPTKK